MSFLINGKKNLMIGMLCGTPTGGLAQHKLEVQNFLIEHNIDIMLISETRFTNNSYILTLKDTTFMTLNIPAENLTADQLSSSYVID